jgi:hypothetical protein
MSRRQKSWNLDNWLSGGSSIHECEQSSDIARRASHSNASLAKRKGRLAIYEEKSVNSRVFATDSVTIAARVNDVVIGLLIREADTILGRKTRGGLAVVLLR